MAETKDHEELKRRLEQVRRLSSTALDPVTRERMNEMARDMEKQLRRPE